MSRSTPKRPGTDLAFDSVFVKNDKHVTGPRVPGETELARAGKLLPAKSTR